MLKSISLRYWIAFLITGFLLLSADYLQYYKGLIPCPLCLIQRFAFGLLAFIFLLGIPLAVKKLGNFFISLFALLISALGMVIAGRQVWLQHLPYVPSANCDVSLQYMIQVLPFADIIKKVFQGTAECSKITWQFLNLSLAEWSLIWFFIFFIFSVRELFLMRR